MKMWNLRDSMKVAAWEFYIMLTAEDKRIAFKFSGEWEGLSHLRTLKSNRKHT